MKKETKNEDLKKMFEPLFKFLGCENMEINDDGYSITFTQRKENKQNAYVDKKEKLREIKTPIGTIYIEHFSYREEDDRIKIYDSDKKYIDYISSETITDGFELNKYIEILKKYSNIEELLNHIVFMWDEYSVDWEVIADRLVERKEHQINSVGELLENEWVNRIGDYYILMPEC